jgi:hypothetical protein
MRGDGEDGRWRCEACAERLRFTPTPFHTDAMMQRLVEALCQILRPTRDVRVA